jgi:phospholipase C
MSEQACPITHGLRGFFTIPSFVIVVVASLTGCAGSSLISAALGEGSLPAHSISSSHKRLQEGLIQHVIVIIQENRTVDNLFQFFPGASTQSWGYNSLGNRVPLYSDPLVGGAGPGHTHGNFLIEYDGGGMNGFDKAKSGCIGNCPPKSTAVYAYVPESDVQPYYTMAEAYSFADEMFQTNQGPSYPAHQYLTSGSSACDGSGSYLNGPIVPQCLPPTPWPMSENPSYSGGGGCDSLVATTVALINPANTNDESKAAFPCGTRVSIFTEAINAGVTWTYYEAHAGSGFWKGADSVEQLWCYPEVPPCNSGSEYYQAHVLHPSAQILNDITAGKLANISYVTPSQAASDHAEHTDGSGPSWVASVVNAVGASKYWSSTAIFVVWDDWGGWYDHVAPTINNAYELGFRVPLIVISPYAKDGYVSHVPHEFGSILHFTEEAFDLPSLGTTDVRSDDLSDCFNFAQKGRKFKVIPARLRARYFLKLPPSSGMPDDD